MRSALQWLVVIVIASLCWVGVVRALLEAAR